MIRFGLILLSLFFYQNTWGKNTNHSVEVKVSGMVCQMCVQGIKKVFKDSVENIEKDVKVNLDTQTVHLNLSNQLSNEQIRGKIKEAGYKANHVNRL